jgi:hypothetical protein
MRLILLVLVSIFACSAAWATVYEWVDGQGVVHMTDEPEKVPDQYRMKMKTREMDTREVQAPLPAAAEKTAPVVQEKKAELYGDQDEGWWRTSFKTIRDELKRLRAKLPAKKEVLPQLHRRWVISMGKMPGQGQSADNPNSYITDSSLSTPGQRRIDYYNQKNEIEKDEARISELEQQLAALEARADWFGVPAGWR